MSNFELNRRQFVGGIVAGLTLATTGKAATNFAAGNTPVIALSDGYFDMPADFFLSTPQSLRDSLGSPVRIAANTFAYRSETRLFLFDAGAGSGAFITEGFPTVSQLPDDLVAAGIDANEVTDIVITHMHPDHIGGLEIGGASAFPNARIHISNVEWKFWNNEEFAANAPDMLRPMIAEVQRVSDVIKEHVVFHRGSASFGDGVSVMPAPGHTPGHSAIFLEGGSEDLLITGDVMVHEDVHFANPNYGWALDIDGELAVSTRKKLLDMIVADNLMVAAAHVTKPGLGHVDRDGDGYRFVAL